jgi:rubredoxin
VIIVRTPAFPWLEQDFQCPDCQVVVRFELSDLTSLPKIAVRHEQGEWIVRRPCPVCGPVKHFRQAEVKK